MEETGAETMEQDIIYLDNVDNDLTTQSDLSYSTTSSATFHNRDSSDNQEGPMARNAFVSRNGTFEKHRGQLQGNSNSSSVPQRANEHEQTEMAGKRHSHWLPSRE